MEGGILRGKETEPRRGEGKRAWLRFLPSKEGLESTRFKAVQERGWGLVSIIMKSNEFNF